MIYQQIDPASPNYINNRVALTGNNVSALVLPGGLNLGWTLNLEALTDDDYTNYTSFNSGISAAIAVNPIIGVKDNNNYYSKGTSAGFRIAAPTEGSLLNLDVIKLYSIAFYKDDELVGTVPCDTSKPGGLLGLGLSSFSTGEASMDLTAVAPEDFNEIRLIPAGGINVNAVTSMKVLYGFIGQPKKYTLTNQGDNPGGIEEYCKDYNRTITLSSTSNNLIDSNLLNDGPSANTLNLGNVTCSVTGNTIDDEAPFKAGSLVGIHYVNGSVLNLDLGGASYIKLLDKNGKEVQSEHLNTNLVKLGLASGGAGDFIITANEDFYTIKLIIAGASVTLGATVIKYFYISPKPDNYL